MMSRQKERPLTWDHILNEMKLVFGDNGLPSVSLIQRETPDSFRILISTIISLRTRDAVTISVSRRLFQEAVTPQEILDLGLEALTQHLYPAGFYRNKASQIERICKILLNDYKGTVPSGLDELLALPGVGLKTANLVRSLGFGIPAICVDIHVHRISNRLGMIKTTTPDKSVDALEKSLPKKYWIPVNEIMVTYGQKVCTPQSPWCSRCTLADQCPREGVSRSR